MSRAVRVFKRYLKIGDTAPLWVSEGGLEPPSAGGHRTSPALIETLTEQAFRCRGRLLSVVWIHPHSSAPVSREVSRRPFAMPLKRGPAEVPLTPGRARTDPA